MADVVELSDNDFQSEVLQSTEPVLVDFWAPWCAPCWMIAPVVEQLAAENAGSAKVARIDVSQYPRMAAAYDVMNIPALIIFKGGEVFERFMGVQQKRRLQDALDQAKGA
jgi:thioredoxin 1